MGTLTDAALAAEAEAIVKEAWAIYAASGDPRDAEMARMLQDLAEQPIAAKPRRKVKRSAAARKRRALKGSVVLDASAPILDQVRNVRDCGLK